MEIAAQPPRHLPDHESLPGNRISEVIDEMQSEEYVKRSVLSYVNKVTTLATGEKDCRTPISEAEQYYAALKLRKVESVLVRFPAEPHGLSARPSHLVAKILYVSDWFDKHRRN